MSRCGDKTAFVPDEVLAGSFVHSVVMKTNHSPSHVVEPSVTRIDSPSNNLGETVSVFGVYVVCFENIDSLRKWVSDSEQKHPCEHWLFFLLLRLGLRHALELVNDCLDEFAIVLSAHLPPVPFSLRHVSVPVGDVKH